MYHAFDGSGMPATMARKHTYVGPQEGQWPDIHPPRMTADIREREPFPHRVPLPAGHVPAPTAAAIAPQFAHREPTQRQLFVDGPRAPEIVRTTLAQRRIPARMQVHVVVPAPRVLDSLPPRRQSVVDMEQHSFQQSMNLQVATRRQWEAATAHARLSDDP